MAGYKRSTLRNAISVRVSDDTLRRLEARARAQRSTVAAVVRAMLDDPNRSPVRADDPPSARQEDAGERASNRRSSP